MNWISAKDKMPELGKPVLVWAKSFPDSEPEYCIDYTFINGNGNVVWDWCEDYPTHWMPLPEPPKD